VPEHTLLRRRHLDRLRCAKELTDKVRHLTSRLAARLAVGLHPLNQQVGQHRDHEQRQEDDQRDAGVDAQHHHHRHDGKDTERERENDLDHESGELVRVTTEAADRLSGRPGHSTRPRSVQNAAEQVLAQQGGVREPIEHVQANVAKDKDRPPQCCPDQQGRQRIRVQTDLSLAGQAIKESTGDEPRHLKAHSKDHQVHGNQGYEPPWLVSTQPHQVLPGGQLGQVFLFVLVSLRLDLFVTHASTSSIMPVCSKL